MRTNFLASTSAAVAACIVLATPVYAAVSYDTSLSPPGTYFGTGNANAHWTVDDETGGVELGVQTLIRFTNAVIPTAGTAMYYVPLGDTAVAGKSGSAWGFAFSFNSNSALSSYAISLSVLDVLTGQTVTFDPTNPAIIPDNAFTGSNPVTGFQNAEAISFAAGGNANNDTYVITLSASSGGTPVGSVSETVIAGAGAPLPEPASLALFGAGLLGLRLVRSKTLSRR